MAGRMIEQFAEQPVQPPRLFTDCPDVIMERRSAGAAFVSVKALCRPPCKVFDTAQRGAKVMCGNGQKPVAAEAGVKGYSPRSGYRLAPLLGRGASLRHF